MGGAGGVGGLRGKGGRVGGGGGVVCSSIHMAAVECCPLH